MTIIVIIVITGIMATIGITTTTAGTHTTTVAAHDITATTAPRTTMTIQGTATTSRTITADPPSRSPSAGIGVGTVVDTTGITGKA